jgi:hypothetical protein
VQRHDTGLNRTPQSDLTRESSVWRRFATATALRNRQEFQRSQLTELASTDFESWARGSFEIATKIAYRNGVRIGIPKGGSMDCGMIAAAPVLPGGYVVSAGRIADRRMMLAGYRLAALVTRIMSNLVRRGSKLNTVGLQRSASNVGAFDAVVVWR